MIDADLYRRLFAELAAIGRTDAGWQRLAWGPGEDAARTWFARTATSLDLEVVQDPAANLWAVEPGADAARWIATGSHVDTVAGGGAFDGALGVVAGLVAVDAARRAPRTGSSRLAVGCMADEEGPRFGLAIYGSRALAGELDPVELLSRTDADGLALRDLAAARGVTAETLRAAPAFRERLAAWIEVHIEQGRRLADVPAAVGVATRLAPRERWRLRVAGVADHAGTTPMAGRRDALVAAARVILVAETAASSEPGAVATVGDLRVDPGSSNVIPGAATLTLDVRAGDAEDLARVRDRIHAAGPGDWVRLSADPGSTFDDGLRAALRAAAVDADVAAADLAAYAGHDAGVLARHLPAAMLFVRNETGISHNPSEQADEADCLAACDVLARTLVALKGTSP